MNGTGFSQFIRETRAALGMTQSQLAQAAGVSLPTIQNIEAGKGNPSLSTITDLIAAFKMRIRIEPIGADWDLLAVCGAPLLRSDSRSVAPTPELLSEAVRAACVELAGESDVSDRERKEEALSALLLAIRAHFPTFYRERMNGEIFDRHVPSSPSGRIIKLKRQAVAVLSTYL